MADGVRIYKRLNKTIAEQVAEAPEFDAITEAQAAKLSAYIAAYFAGHPYSEGQFAREIKIKRGRVDRYIVSTDPADYSLEFGFKHHRNKKYYPGHHLWRKFTE